MIASEAQRQRINEINTNVGNMGLHPVHADLQMRMSHNFVLRPQLRTIGYVINIIVFIIVAVVTQLILSY